MVVLVKNMGDCVFGSSCAVGAVVMVLIITPAIIIHDIRDDAVYDDDAVDHDNGDDNYDL